MNSEMLFEPPAIQPKMLHHIYNSHLALLSKLQKGLLFGKNRKER